jgi:uncharacterized protein YdeI (YjbR/CyaY-like superfamily)
MASKDPRVDEYIAKAAPFAQPILKHIRKQVHAACPGAEETIKWSFPHFDYRGSILCSMAAFKQHCAFGFFKASEMYDPQGILTTVGRTSMGQLGKLTTVADLPAADILKEYIKDAMRLNEEGIKPKARPKANPNPDVDVPADLQQALDKHKPARQVFDAFPPGHRREYVAWIEEAKREATREKRIATTIEWLTEGKSRDWKYKK